MAGPSGYGAGFALGFFGYYAFAWHPMDIIDGLPGEALHWKLQYEYLNQKS